MACLIINHQILYPYETTHTFISNLIDPIGYFLEKLGMRHHSDNFREEEIDLEVLEMLEDRDMDDLNLNEEEKERVNRFQKYILFH